MIAEVSASSLVDTKEAARRVSRRHWPDGLKRRMVAESRAPGASVSVVARRYDVNANQLFKWRRDYAAAEPGCRPTQLPVALRASGEAPAGSGTIEIDLAGGARVRVSGAVDAGVLRQVLEQLR